MSPSSSPTEPAGGVTARPAEGGDLGRLGELHLASVSALGPVRGGPQLAASHSRGPDAPAVTASLAAALDDPGTEVLVGCIGEEVVGHAVVTCGPGDPTAELRELYVEPGARQVGVGSALLEAARAVARAQGCTGLDAIALPGDRATKNFFEDHAMVARAIVVHGSVEP